MRMERTDHHRAYLVRCWQEGARDPGETRRRRFSVEEVLHERQGRGFDSLEALIKFLGDELAGGVSDPRSRLQRWERRCFRSDGTSSWRATARPDAWGSCRSDQVLWNARIRSTRCRSS